METTTEILKLTFIIAKILKRIRTIDKCFMSKELILFKFGTLIVDEKP